MFEAFGASTVVDVEASVVPDAELCGALPAKYAVPVTTVAASVAAMRTRARW